MEQAEIHALLQALDEWDARFTDCANHLEVTDIYTIWLRTFRLSRRIQHAYQAGQRERPSGKAHQAYTGDTQRLE